MDVISNIPELRAALIKRDVPFEEEKKEAKVIFKIKDSTNVLGVYIPAATIIKAHVVISEDEVKVLKERYLREVTDEEFVFRVNNWILRVSKDVFRDSGFEGDVIIERLGYECRLGDLVYNIEQPTSNILVPYSIRLPKHLTSKLKEAGAEKVREVLYDVFIRGRKVVDEYTLSQLDRYKSLWEDQQRIIAELNEQVKVLKDFIWEKELEDAFEDWYVERKLSVNKEELRKEARELISREEEDDC